MDINNIIVVTVGIVTISSALYKLTVEPFLNIKIANLETKHFLIVDNLKTNLNDKITNLDRKIDIHLQDYANYKDANLLQFNGLNEKINHTWTKTQTLFSDEKSERKEVQALLLKQNDVKHSS